MQLRAFTPWQWLVAPSRYKECQHDVANGMKIQFRTQDTNGTASSWSLLNSQHGGLFKRWFYLDVWIPYHLQQPISWYAKWIACLDNWRFVCAIAHTNACIIVNHRMNLNGQIRNWLSGYMLQTQDNIFSFTDQCILALFGVSDWQLSFQEYSFWNEFQISGVRAHVHTCILVAMSCNSALSGKNSSGRLWSGFFTAHAMYNSSKAVVRMHSSSSSTV